MLWFDGIDVRDGVREEVSYTQYIIFNHAYPRFFLPIFEHSVGEKLASIVHFLLKILILLTLTIL